MKLVRFIAVPALVALVALPAFAGSAFATSSDSSSDASAPAASSGSESASAPAPAASASVDTSAPATVAPSTDTSVPPAPAAPTTTTTVAPPTAPAPETSTSTPTTPDDVADVPEVAVEDCTDTPAAAFCVPETSNKTPVARKTTSGTGTGTTAELPFTGPGDVLIAILVAALAGTGGMLLMLMAGGRESIEALSPRGMRSTTGFRVAYRELLKRQVDGDDKR